MVISSHMRNSKNRKLNVEHDTNGSCTNIDYLPSTILHHILSLMPTKDAVRTSILSKIWRNMWKSISNLDFEENSPSERELFMNFVERVLLLCDSLNVEKFCLSCSVLGDESRINAWISAALKHNVQELCIYLSAFAEPFVLPRCLFTCESLTTLEIEMYNVLKLPPSICLSRLKSLTLKDIKFPSNHLTQQLFSGCPVLEELCIDSCYWLYLHVVSICAPKLRCLTICEEVNEEEDQGDYHGCQVLIFGTSLEYFNYTGELANDYCLYNTSLLHGACIDVYQYGPIPREREVAYRAIKLLRGVSNVKNLHLTSECVQAFDDAKELFPHLPTFNNLAEFKVDGLMDFDCESVPNFLRTFPCLESVVFSEGICIYANHGIDWSLDPVPSCFSTHLKFIKVDRFTGGKEELHLIKFFLENATVLNDMVICMSMGLAQDLEKQKRVKEQILNFPSASVCLSVVFEIVFDSAKELIPHLPTFSNLANLDVSGIINFGCEAVPNMLQTFPRLKSLVFSEEICISIANCNLDDWSLDPMRPCFLAHLKYIRIENFDGHKDDIVLVRIFLQHAKVLDKMVICCSRDVTEKVKEWILNLPRASVSCSVVI